MIIYHYVIHKWTTNFAIALKMWSQIVSFKPWLLNFDHKFDGQGVKNFYTHLYIEL